jgi:predicted dehydrogenase
LTALSKKKINVGIIGCGLIGFKRASSLIDGNIIGCYDKKINLAKKFSREFNYEENQKILANDKIKFNQEINLLIKEIVDINTPNNVEKKKNPQNDIEEFMKDDVNYKLNYEKYGTF